MHRSTMARGRPLLLDAELDLKLRSVIVSLRSAGSEQTCTLLGVL